MGLDEMFEGEVAGLDEKVEGVGAGRQEQGQGSKGTNSEGEGAGRHKLSKARGAGRRGGHSYLLANPKLAEAHGDGTVVPPTGTDRSAPQHLPGANLPCSQHLSNQGGGMSKGEGAGRQKQGQDCKVIDSNSEGEGGMQ